MQWYNHLIENIRLVLNIEDADAFYTRVLAGAIFALIFAGCFLIMIVAYRNNVWILFVTLKISLNLLFVIALWLGAVEGLHGFLYNIVEKKYYD
jgi:hypothetical protein